MNTYYETFMELFSQNKRDHCVLSAVEEVESGKITIPVLYEEILVKALYTIDDCPEDNPGCIWDEHVKTSIVRTIIEALYPTVIKLGHGAEKTGKKIVLACPEREYHDLGLRMMSDFFQINGYHVVYVGSNTPRKQIWEVVKTEQPDYLGISVTDYYLLSEANKILEKIREECGKNIKILLGGQAFMKNPHIIDRVEEATYIENYEDVLSLGRRDSK